MAPPAHDVAELMSRENVGNIPRDQRSLLEGENSWAVDLKDGPHGLATVPSHVLATLKEAFVRLQDESERRNPEHEETPDLPPAVDDLDRRGGYSPGSTPARSSVVPSSSPERSIAWTPSQAGSRDHDEISDSGLPVDETPASKGLAPLTQPPPARAHATPTPTPGPSSSSSSASEPEDLEVELPQAQENSEAPINRVARQAHLTASPREPSSIVASIAATGNTPPCAQPRVASAPGTSSETSKSSALPADAAQRRPRRMKPISFGQDSPKAAVVDPAPFTRTHSVRTFAEPNIHDSAPLSSVTSAPYNDGGIEGFPPPPPPHNFAKYAPPQNKTTRPLDDENRAVGPPDEIGRLPYDGLEASPPRQTHMGQLYRIQAAVDMRIDEHVEPYGAFSATYPDYATVHYGNLIGFIQACVYLEMVQEKRVIREYLYDDFIRAWSGGYVRYANRAAQNPLSAIEWFNSIRGPILFNRMRVNNDNIATIVNAYPEEVARFRALMNKEERQDETPAPEPEMELELEAEPGNEPEKEQGAEIVDFLDSDSAMDISGADERRDEMRQRPKTQPPMKLPPPTRRPPSLPAPSRPAPPPPPPPPPPLPQPLSPELGSDDFGSPPHPPKPQSLPKPQSRSRPRSRAQTHQPRPPSKPRPQPQPQPLTLPQRQQSPRRYPAPARAHTPLPVPAPAAPPPPATRRPPKSTDAKSTPRPAEHPEHPVSSSRATPSSRSRPIPKPRKRSAEERARLREHFRRKASSSSTSLIGSSVERIRHHEEGWTNTGK